MVEGIERGGGYSMTEFQLPHLPHLPVQRALRVPHSLQMYSIFVFPIPVTINPGCINVLELGFWSERATMGASDNGGPACWLVNRARRFAHVNLGTRHALWLLDELR
jgi:hypothetical protein